MSVKTRYDEKKSKSDISVSKIDREKSRDSQEEEKEGGYRS